MFLRGDPAVTSMELADLVGPGGFKNRMLDDAPDRTIIAGISAYVREMRRAGVGAFVDFREQGVRGMRLLRQAISGQDISAIVLGRPVLDDLSDLEEVLKASDGIGISSLSDVSPDVARVIARAVHREGKILALHLSEERREDVDVALSLRPHLLVHGLECTADDLRAIARAHIPVVVCPRSSAFFGLNLDVDRMIRSGVKVMLGTDNAMISSGSVLEEAGFLVEEFDVPPETAVQLLLNAKALNRWDGMLLKRPVTRGYVLVEGRSVADVPGARAMAVCCGTGMWQCDLHKNGG
jgi:hypothetical protein